ncbi:huntingtin-interacting protein M [Equus przewalskii]|uniref:Huntingtin-interacting protein M n=1 Tax=Equus przewalskii TaxID=9798 RepID=A0ABM4N9A2_EQUPR
MSEKQNHDSSYQTQAHLPTAELPVSYLDRLLQKDQYAQHQRSSTEVFLFAMVDYLTDYILEKVSAEVSNGGIIPQDVEGAVDNNGAPRRQLRNSAFTLFGEMPGARRSG